MFYHYETQPIPNPLSWYFHHLPQGFLKFQTLYTHFVELVVPWLYFVSGPLGWIAGILTIVFQGCLILSGNLSWLNYLTIAISIACFDDAILASSFAGLPQAQRRWGKGRKGVLGALSLLVVFLSINPAVNLLSPQQRMNTSFDPLHLVNSYGAFGSITKDRTEIILEGTDDGSIGAATQWKEYGVRGQPGDAHRMPGLVSPYHRRLDWLMWFAAMSDYQHYPWILNLVNKLLQNDAEMLRQIEESISRQVAPLHPCTALWLSLHNPEEKKDRGLVGANTLKALPAAYFPGK